MDYQKQANDFAKKHGVTLKVIGEPEYRPYFLDDKEERFVFKLQLSRKGKRHTFTFGQSIASGSEEPDMYSVLAAIEKNDPEDFEWFCSNYGYDTDSRKAEKIYKAVCREYAAVQRLFADFTEDQWDELREIN